MSYLYTHAERTYTLTKDLGCHYLTTPGLPRVVFYCQRRGETAMGTPIFAWSWKGGPRTYPTRDQAVAAYFASLDEVAA